MILTLIGLSIILAALYLAKTTSISIFIIWYVSASLITFCAFYFDKKYSVKNQSRVSENNLHTLELIGGWPGALIASQLFRHKTSKLSYQIVLWSIILIHILFWIWLKWNTLQHFIPLSKLKTLIN